MDESKFTYVSPKVVNEGKLRNRENCAASGNISMDDWEKMCRVLYAYRFGTIDFLDLLARWEETLGIKPPQTD